MRKQRKVTKADAQLAAELDRVPTDEEVAAAAGLTLSEVLTVRASARTWLAIGGRIVGRTAPAVLWVERRSRETMLRGRKQPWMRISPFRRSCLDGAWPKQTSGGLRSTKT